MMELSTQLDLLAQGRGIDEWGDILVIVVMAILWLAGGLAKVLTSKRRAQPNREEKEAAKQPGNRRETWQERLARKAQEIQRAAEARAGQSRPETQASSPAGRPHPARVQPQPPAGRITVRHGPKGDAVMVYERPASAPIPEWEARQAVTVAGRDSNPAPIEPPAKLFSEAPLPTISRESPQPIEPEVAASVSSLQPDGSGPGDIIDYSDPDALKKAILHYEILGKPLALRDASHEASIF